MDRIRPRRLGHANDFRDRQVGRDRAQPFADTVSFVRFEPVQAQFVLFGVNSDGLFAHLVGRAHDADGDFTPVRDQDFLEVGHLHVPWVCG